MKWLYTAWALMGLKIAITALWTLQHHHVAPKLPHAIQETLFWLTKVTPPLFCAALVVWARGMGYRKLTLVFTAFLIFVIPFDAVVVYAMFHGWKGFQF
jgi:hypothetical protein